MRPDRLDEEKCDLCGLCLEVCGRGIFSRGEEVMRFDPGAGACIECGHCMAICPQAALRLNDGARPPPLKPALMPAPEALLHFLRSRRSVRRFKNEVPSRSEIEKLIEAARYSPTGTNKQDVNLVVVTDSERIETLRKAIMVRFTAYDRHLSHPLKRLLLKTLVDKRFGDPVIRAFLRGFVAGYHAGGDPLFHRAPVVVFLHTGEKASTAKDDCCLALFHMVLMAERIGLGSCLLGTAEVAFSKTPSLNDLIGVPRSQPILASACFGYPVFRFSRLVNRKPLNVRWL
ncbi:MAG: nitroreductase family protein [Planctomycetota bacterium]